MNVRLNAYMFFLCFFPVPALALVSIPKDFAHLVEEAERILVGTVESLDGVRLNSGTIVTDITLEDLESVKGDHDEETYTVRMLGGTVGDESFVIAGPPTFQHGWRYLLFVKDNGSVMIPLVGVDHGMFSIRRDYATEQERLYTAHSEIVTAIQENEVVTHSLKALTNTEPLSLQQVLSDIRRRLDQ